MKFICVLLIILFGFNQCPCLQRPSWLPKTKPNQTATFQLPVDFVFGVQLKFSLSGKSAPLEYDLFCGSPGQYFATSFLLEKYLGKEKCSFFSIFWANAIVTSLRILVLNHEQKDRGAEYIGFLANLMNVAYSVFFCEKSRATSNIKQKIDHENIRDIQPVKLGLVSETSFFNLPVKGQKNVWKILNDIKKYIFGFNFKWASKCYFVIGVEEIFILSKKYQQRKKSNSYPWDAIL